MHENLGVELMLNCQFDKAIKFLGSVLKLET